MTMFLNFHLSIAILTLLVFEAFTAFASYIDNGVVGTPVIQCKDNSIQFAVETKNAFKGKVFVKGEYEQRGCKKYFGAKANTNFLPPESRLHGGRLDSGDGGLQGMSQRSQEASPSHNNPEVNNYGSWHSTSEKLRYPERSPLNKAHFPNPKDPHFGGDNVVSSQPVFIARSKECPLQCPPCPGGDESRRQRRKTNQADIELELGTCNLRRDRTVNPPGVQISVVVVVSFHENFITKVDRAYHIQCAYGEPSKVVTAEIEVNTPASSDLVGVVEAPKCRYEIVDESGRLSKNVRVGDFINHRWICSTPAEGIYGMLVHDCYAEDGQGRRELVVDSHGCTRDVFVLPTPTYDSTSLSTTVRSQVFKFADRNSIEFQCSITLCTKADSQCDGVTPPICNGSRSKRSAGKRSNATEPWQLHAQPLTVVDIDSQIDFEAQSIEDTLNAELQSTSTRTRELCLTIIGFGALIASSTFLSTIAGTIGIVYLYTRHSPLYPKSLEAW